MPELDPYSLCVRVPLPIGLDHSSLCNLDPETPLLDWQLEA